jgi:uncharacterized protein (TIGR02679 family)
VALTVGPPVKLDGVPVGLEARAAVTDRIDPDTGERVLRRDRQGRLRYDRVWLQTPRTPSDPISLARSLGLPDDDIGWLTDAQRAAATVRKNGKLRQAERAAAAGLVQLLHEHDFGRVGPLVRTVPHPDAEPAVARWRDKAREHLAGQIAEVTVAWEHHPADALAWASERAGRATPTEAALLAKLGRALPAGNVPMSALALDLTGDSHALWSSGAHATLAVTAAATIAGLAPPTSTAERRDAWDAVGVLTDPWSSLTTGLRLPFHPDHPAGKVVAAHAGLVAVVTLELVSQPGPLVAPPPADGGTLWVVENNATLTALVHIDTDEPVLCRNGTPSVSDRALVRSAAAAGWTVAVTSDFEPVGLAGARTLLDDAGSSGRPWRVGADDYDPSLSADRFDGRPGATPWDPRLQAKLDHHRTRVLEEHRLPAIVGDVQQSR